MPTPVTHIRIPVETLAAIDAAAAAEGVTRTRWVLAAVEARLYPHAVDTEAPSSTGRTDVPTAEPEPVPTDKPRVVELMEQLESSVAEAKASAQRHAATVPLVEGLVEDVACRHPLVRRVGRTCLDCNARL